jgi:hypothetical protein
MDSPPRLIELTHGMWAIVDAEDYDGLMKYKWRAVQSYRSWYAKTTIGKPPHQYDLCMHRVIAHTPKNKVCHHKNRNTLDNRRINLKNMHMFLHKLEHMHNRILIKYTDNHPQEKPLTPS